jgi:hypothetical protein
VQLLGGSFVKEALGLLEQQINVLRQLQEMEQEEEDEEGCSGGGKRVGKTVCVCFGWMKL